MDPLVRCSVTVQRWAARAAAVLAAFGFGALALYHRVFGVGFDVAALGPIEIGALLLFVVSTIRALSARLSAHDEAASTRVDLALFAHLAVAVRTGVAALPGGTSGPGYALVYALYMTAAAFSKPAATVALIAASLLSEFGEVQLGLARADELPSHAVLGAIFALLNSALFRAEIARVRRLSRGRIESEIKRMKDAARSYRLLVAPTGITEPRHVRQGGDDERLLQSGVDEIHQALEFSLELLRRTLRLHSAALYWVEGGGTRLVLQEIATGEEQLRSGPFSARDGILGAAITRRETVTVLGAQASQQVPHYASNPGLGAVAVTPVLEHGHVRGLLVVDRLDRVPFDGADLELLEASSRFLHRTMENERTFIQLERAKLEQGKLYRAVEQLATATTEAEVVEAGVNAAREFASFDFAVVTLWDRDAQVHEICAASGDGTGALVGQRFAANTGLASMVIANRHALPYRGQFDARRQVVFQRGMEPPPTPSLLVLPLLVHDRALGTLVLGCERPGAFGDAVRQALEVLASHVAVSLANARMVEKLEELATTDGLTGLLNKRALIEMAGLKLQSALRFDKPLSLLVTDIDHFKKVNDTYGHDIGDVVIKGLGTILKKMKRGTDLVGRFGGEEFVIVCEETDQRGALLLAERIRKELEKTSFQTDKGPIKVTCSLGVATCPAAGTDYDTLFKATDEALYASKRGGRNRVTVWQPKLAGIA